MKMTVKINMRDLFKQSLIATKDLLNGHSFSDLTIGRQPTNSFRMGNCKIREIFLKDKVKYLKIICEGGSKGVRVRKRST